MLYGVEYLYSHRSSSNHTPKPGPSPGAILPSITCGCSRTHPIHGRPLSASGSGSSATIAVVSKKCAIRPSLIPQMSMIFRANPKGCQQTQSRKDTQNEGTTTKAQAILYRHCKRLTPKNHHRPHPKARCAAPTPLPRDVDTPRHRNPSPTRKFSLTLSTHRTSTHRVDK